MEKAPTTKYVLVDYENVQPEDFSALTGEAVRVKVFVGPNQATLPTTMVTALGSATEYVALKKQGKNALDFLIAYQLGQLSARDPSAQFEILSNDTGFDPLIDHLCRKGVSVERTTYTGGNSVIRSAIANLEKHKGKTPKTPEKLRNALKNSFKQLSEEQLTNLIEGLQHLGVIAIAADAVTYDFSARAKRG